MNKIIFALLISFSSTLPAGTLGDSFELLDINPKTAPAEKYPELWTHISDAQTAVNPSINHGQALMLTLPAVYALGLTPTAFIPATAAYKQSLALYGEVDNLKKAASALGLLHARLKGESKTYRTISTGVEKVGTYIAEKAASVKRRVKGFFGKVKKFFS